MGEVASLRIEEFCDTQRHRGAEREKQRGYREKTSEMYLIEPM